MTAAKRGYYCLIQYCPDPGRLEAANLGVLLFSPEVGFLDARMASTNERVRRFFGAASFEGWALDSAKDALRARLRTDRESFRSLEDLEAAGVCAATFPSVALFAAAQGVRHVLRLLKHANSLAPCQDHLVPLDDYYDLVGLRPLLAREEGYDQAAAALVHRRAAE